MESYQHDVFFEAKSLSDEELGQIQLYFKIKRKSGGGDCEIYKVGNSTYKISFMDKKAQERVLERKDHVIKAEGQEEIHVSLKRENVADSSKQPTASANQKCASAKSVEKVLKLDHYLLRFFSECKSQYSDLETRLSKVSSTFEINIDCEELVVTRDPAAADVFPLKKWEFAVDEVFETLKSRYIIHFEVERDKYAILEENSFLQSDKLKMYFEELTSLAVVVGERTEVEKILKFLSGLQDKQQIQQQCCVSEKQYDLIKEQFEPYIKANLPTLKIAQERAGVVLLKGPEKEVQAGEKELLKLALGIKEKRIPSHRALLTFLESSGSVQRFQNRFQQSLRSPVLLETSGSDLLLLSLSDGALEEAATAVQRDVCLETVRLENTQKSSAFNTLKEDLSEAVRQANRESVKVELKYQDESTTDPKVQLVGYTTEVSKLKNIVLEYKMNHQNHHATLPLPRPEMAAHFPEILAMTGVKKSSVEIKPMCLPSPCVHLTGPRCEVESLKDSLDSFLQSLATKQCDVKGPGVQQFFQGEGARTLQLVKNSYLVAILPIDDKRERGKVPRYMSSISLQPSASASASSQDSLDFDKEINIKVVVGSLEQQQADVFIAPMIQANMTSTLIGSSLLNKAGRQLQNNFNNAKGNQTLKPGDVLEVDATPALGCSKVFFMECAPKGNKHNSEKALRSGLGRVFELCEQNSWGSVALPVIGPGMVLSIPVKDAVNILTHEICEFLSGPTGHLHSIHITIMPNYAHSEEMFQTICGNLSAKMVDNAGQALFHSLTSDLDEIIMPVHGIELHLVFGDITNETTDAIVNTTDFKDFQTAGVCKDILTKAGPQIQTQLTGAQVASGQIFTTPPGGFPCKTIMHVCGERNPDVIKTLAKEIVVQCEQGRYRSVAIPAICAGQGGLAPNVVAKSILEGVKEGIQGANLQHLKNIRIILLKINVFLAFQATAKQIFGGNIQLTAPGPLVPTSVTTRGSSGSTRSRSHSLPLPVALDLTSLVTSLPDTENIAAFLVIGHTNNEVSDACRELQRAYEDQCSTQTFSPDEIERLTQGEMNQLRSKVDSLHLQIEQSSSDRWVVKGLKDGVNEVVRLIQDALRRQVREKDQIFLFSQVTWCILGPRGNWQKVPKDMNFKLEKGDVKGGIVDAQGVKWTVDLRTMKATARDSRQVTALKRLENLSDFTLPIYWDNMSQSDPLKVIDLDQSSTEYKTVKVDFKKTVTKQCSRSSASRT
ncbi:protein mono-ADP-ribosyltransferase PARP14-like isoform X2 [Onychostoma macrolepis]|uniref:protein mono-ADP-ribosyltransferase PARP14-like isoform X2 n=1 Tax=Onychostoma macrolepis TaxID=369639 RepID=UPI00272ABEA3|nr:protein mono-ADP-ribosyltransferase PARP14-like isoform X2 [Onychostoma macrolepis]